jgi:PAS domain S-box-containing protein
VDQGDFRKLISSVRSGSRLTSIWAIPAVALSVAAGVLVWVSYDEYQDTIQQEYRFLDAHARIAQNQLGSLLRSIRRVLTRITEELPSDGNRGAYSERLAQLNREAPEIRTLAVLNAAGRVEMAANPTLAGFDGSKREYYTAHLGGPRRFDLHISRPYKTVYGDYSVGFSLPIHDESKEKLLGVAVAGVHYSYFDAAMKETRPAAPRSSIAILNDDGDILYRQPNPETSVGGNVAANEAFRTFLRSGREATYARATARLDGVERLYVIRPIPGTPLCVATSDAVDDVLAMWRSRLAFHLALFAFGSALILRLTWMAERRQKENLAGKQFIDRLVQTANAMMIGVDASGRIIVVNEATERITGWLRGDLIGRSIFDTLMPRERYPKAWRAFTQYHETGVVPRAFEAPILTRSREERIIAWQNSAVFEHEDLQAVLSFGIDVTERVELQQARSREEVSRRLVGIHEEERRRLAVELHDRTSPNLTVLNLNMRLLAESLPKDGSAELANLIEDTSATLADTIASIRGVAFDFRPPLLDYAGLWPALTAYARKFSRRTGIAVRTSEWNDKMALPPEVGTNLFRIAQEALTNCAKYSQAERISITASVDESGLTLTISDDGVGFDVKRARGPGLTMMRQRAEFVGGRLQVESHPGEGTRIAVFVPLRGSPVSQPAGAASAQAPASQAMAPSAAERPLAKDAVSK